jgi:hypothetical protein
MRQHGTSLSGQHLTDRKILKCGQTRASYPNREAHLNKVNTQSVSFHRAKQMFPLKHRESGNRRHENALSYRAAHDS